MLARRIGRMPGTAEFNDNIHNCVERQIMCHTEHREYQGWNITVRCSHRLGGDIAVVASTYTATATAELQAGQDPGYWIDPRLQLVTTGNRSFDSSAGSIEVLLIEVMLLIDALRK